jgi:hypothetical protein
MIYSSLSSGFEFLFFQEEKEELDRILGTEIFSFTSGETGF